MKKLLLILLLLLAGRAAGQHPDRVIFAFGGDINTKFVRHAAQLTGKPSPRVCFLPTASADNADNIKYWEFICDRLGLKPHVMRVWVNSARDTASFRDILLSMDAIVVGGGNTLNMMGIWKAQGIDTVLQQAYRRGIVLAGGSAGSLCWFETGTSDCRPGALSMVDGLAILPWSHSPHYGEPDRKELYQGLIASGRISPGYACDDNAGIVFRNGRFAEAVSLDHVSHSYYVSRRGDQVKTEELPSRILLNPGHIATESYTAQSVGRKVDQYPAMYDLRSPLHSYLSIIQMVARGDNPAYYAACTPFLQQRLGGPGTKQAPSQYSVSLTGATIDRILVYDGQLAGVVSSLDSRNYNIWYLLQQDGRWLSAGEDLGGPTPQDAEISFREKAKTIVKNNKLKE